MNTPSVMTSMRVRLETLEPKRTRRPTVSPTCSPSVDAMRAAAARAASRRGSSSSIFLSFAHGSSSSTSGTRVVLPAPGGATSTAELPPRNAAVRRGSASSIGKLVAKIRAAGALTLCGRADYFTHRRRGGQIGPVPSLRARPTLS